MVIPGSFLSLMNYGLNLTVALTLPRIIKESAPFGQVALMVGCRVPIFSMEYSAHCNGAFRMICGISLYLNAFFPHLGKRA